MSDPMLKILGDWPPTVAVAPDVHIYLTNDDRFEIWRDNSNTRGCGGNLMNTKTGERVSIASLIRAALPEGDPRYSSEPIGMLDQTPRSAPVLDGFNFGLGDPDCTWPAAHR